ncbi:LLM class flavin-dependent oxidoreductase [Candidatus Laterigemmans baculatus]|uniref:LLM class flavin-dependent oxidoreductase n=1 Tax=Candidatus Laterigemmans baculatus TaxID=2770505 RepID=UPI0013DD25B6|nr:LLM class flavin-dependent oxidoreductase [Candidatus Laterigemmans baculatus]
MTTLAQIRYSVLDLSPIRAGGTAAEAFRNSLELAQHAEQWGYHRYWVAEHHSIPGVASAATAVVIGHLAGGTSRIRVGAGGIMLPNHAPLVIAEQFGTLESLYPGRIDLGLGRAPGGDPQTARALRRGLGNVNESFPRDLAELRNYFRPPRARQSAATPPAMPVASLPAVRAIPGEGLEVPLYLLGSSDFSARLAAELGLPFAFASHFAPDYLLPALQLYRSRFTPSEALAEPYVMVGVNLFAADSDAEARRLFTTLQQQFVHLVRGAPTELLPPLESMEGRWTPQEQAHVERMTRVSAVGSPETVRQDLERIVAATGADEIIATAQIFDPAARLRSFEIAADVFRAS